MKYQWQKMICVGVVGGMLMLSSSAEAEFSERMDWNCQHEHENKIYFDVKALQVDEQEHSIEYYAKKNKQPVKYRCKICGKTYNLKLMAAGHVRGEHGKILTGRYLQTVKG